MWLRNYHGYVTAVNGDHEVVIGSATFHLLEAGLLPAKKIGKQWCASRRKLLHALGADQAAPIPTPE
jgi:hypothetical protein